VHTVAAAGSLVFEDAAATSPNGNSDGVRENFPFSRRLLMLSFVGRSAGLEMESGSLGLAPRHSAADDLDDNFISTAFAFDTIPPLPAGAFTNTSITTALAQQERVSANRLRPAPPPPMEPLRWQRTTTQRIRARPRSGSIQSDGTPPDAAVPSLPSSNASVFCQQRRAFSPNGSAHVMDQCQQAAAGVAALHIGLVKDFSAVFFPRVTISQSGLNVNIGPSGAIAGLCARIDGSRGVWKTPAGTEADLRGIVGLDYKLSDSENGITNPRAVNTIRISPGWDVNWGGRTADGDDSLPASTNISASGVSPCTWKKVFTAA